MNIAINQFIGLLTILFISHLSPLFAQTLIPNQGKEYPVYTSLDTTYFNNVDITSYDKNWNSYVNIKTLRTYKEKLKPFVEQNDPWATYLYAECHCHLSASSSFSYNTKGITNSVDISADTSTSVNRSKCIEYLIKAEKMNVAWASWILYDKYKKGNWLSPNYNLSLGYLHQTTKLGDAHLQSLAYAQLGNLYLPEQNQVGKNPNFPSVSYNLDTGIYYMEKYYKLNPNSNLKKYAAQLRKYQKYDEAVEVYLSSEDWKLRFGGATALIIGYFVEGELVTRDKVRGLTIIRDLIGEEEKKANGGDSELIINWFNRLHYCYCDFLSEAYSADNECLELITQKEMGKYWLEDYQCK